MVNEKKIEVLKGAAQRKQQDALRRTDEAINRLVKQGKRITFPAVAEEAQVSVTYLYKYDEIKQRIEQLRDQQSHIEKPKSPQAASDSSKANIVYNLKQEINKLRAENKGLRDQVEMVYGRLLTAQSAENKVTILEIENRHLEAENQQLKELLEECRKTQNSRLDNVTPLAKRSSGSPNVSDTITTELARIGVELNTTLLKTIKLAPQDLVLSAIKALKEAMQTTTIKRPGGWLNQAIKDGWKPNEKHLPQDKAEREIFKEWFDLAYKQRLVLASSKNDDGTMTIYQRDGNAIPFEQMLRDYPLARLKVSL